jgi:homoserine O-acetyltransferase
MARIERIMTAIAAGALLLAAKSVSKAPALYHATVRTSAGTFVVEVHREWSPRGADRFWELVRAHYYDDSRFFRVVAGKWAQFGIAGDPKVAQAWRDRTIPDDTLVQHNLPSFVAFSNTGPGTRSTQIYIDLRDNSELNDHEAAFAPFGRVVRGMEVAERLYSGYGEHSGGGMRAGHQDAMFEGGNAYLDANFARLDHIIWLKVARGGI